MSVGVRPPTARLMLRWDVGEPGEFVPFAEGPGDLSWRVRAEGGRFLLRQFVTAGRRQVRFRLQVTAALEAAGLPVPTPVPARDGGPLVEVGGRRYALYPWIDGRRRDGLDLGAAQCAELGRLLGGLHAELDTMTPPVQQSLLVPATRVRDAVATADRLLAAASGDADAGSRGDTEGDGDAAPDATPDAAPAPTPDTALSDADTGGEAGGPDPLAARLIGERRAMLLELADHEPPAAETFAAGHVHGGFHSENLLYGAFTGGVVAVFGWGGMRVAPFAADLVHAATSLFAYGDERGMDLERMEAFVRGHATVFPLDPGQLQSAVHRLWWERLCDLGALDPGTVALVEWWTANLDRTLDVVAAAYTHTAD